MAFDISGVCIFFLLLITIQQVIAKGCTEIEKIRDCDQCSACGGHWCAQPRNVQAKEVIHCSRTWVDGWCLDSMEAKDLFLEVTGSSVSPTKIDQSISIGVPHRIPVSPSYKINMETDAQNDFKHRTVCENDKCFIEVLAGAGFCAKSQTPTFVNAEIKIEGVSQTVKVSYRVSCSCQCSAEVLENSMFCNHKGNFSCGVCSCQDKWFGEECNKYCEDKRGDQSEDSCIHPSKPGVKCSGNGICGPCQECECFNEGIGSQYFQPENLCLDLCSYINYYYEECIGITEYGPCDHHTSSYPLNIEPCNATLLEEKDDQNRNVWIQCSGNINDNSIVEFSASRTGNEIYMMIGACGASKGAIVTSTGVKVPWIASLVVAGVALAAAAGYLVWRHQAPPPVHSAQLDNFDAENATGRNPLYKPPTSFFKNPTYGKL